MKEKILKVLIDLRYDFNELHKGIEWAGLDLLYPTASKIFRSIEKLEKIANEKMG